MPNTGEGLIAGQQLKVERANLEKRLFSLGLFWTSSSGSCWVRTNRLGAGQWDVNLPGLGGLQLLQAAHDPTPVPLLRITRS